jgi:hypothetical protein
MKTFETKAFLMTIHDDLLIEFKVKANVNLQASDVWESRDLSVNYMPHKKIFVLFEGHYYLFLIKKMKMPLFLEKLEELELLKNILKHVAALALYSNKAYERIIGSLFLKINKPLVPTEFFDNREQAIAWLKIKQKSTF